MNERVMQFRVGVVILATFLIAAILVLSFIGSNPLFHSTYTIYIKFAEAPGVTSDTPIRKAGIRIGQVRSVRFADNDEGVLVTAEIDHDRKIYHDEQCRAVSSILLGDTTLEFVRLRGTPLDKTPIESGAVIQGQIGSDMTGSVAAIQKQAAETLETLRTAGQDMHSVLTRIDRLIADNESKIDRLIDESEDTMKLLQKALASSNDILGDPKLRAQIKETIGEMPEILRETKSTVERMGGTFASLEQNMRNVEGLTKPLGERGEALVGEAADSMHKLNLLTENLLRFTQAIGNSQGSLGAFLNDKELYQRVNHLLADVDDLTRDLKPILSNAEIFSDKIARHPSELIKGALRKDAGAGLKDNPYSNDSQPEQPQARRWPIGGSGGWSLGGNR